VIEIWINKVKLEMKLISIWGVVLTI